jgi:hypothetical protein
MKINIFGGLILFLTLLKTIISLPYSTISSSSVKYLSSNPLEKTCFCDQTTNACDPYCCCDPSCLLVGYFLIFRTLPAILIGKLLICVYNRL